MCVAVAAVVVDVEVVAVVASSSSWLGEEASHRVASEEGRELVQDHSWEVASYVG